jgi:hypothetical protein
MKVVYKAWITLKGDFAVQETLLPDDAALALAVLENLADVLEKGSLMELEAASMALARTSRPSRVG